MGMGYPVTDSAFVTQQPCTASSVMHDKIAWWVECNAWTRIDISLKDVPTLMEHLLTDPKEHPTPQSVTRQSPLGNCPPAPEWYRAAHFLPPPPPPHWVQIRSVGFD